MLKILYFSGGQQFFKISPGIKALYNRDRKLFHLLARETVWDRGDNFRKFINLGSQLLNLDTVYWTKLARYVTKLVQLSFSRSYQILGSYQIFWKSFVWWIFWKILNSPLSPIYLKHVLHLYILPSNTYFK